MMKNKWVTRCKKIVISIYIDILTTRYATGFTFPESCEQFKGAINKLERIHIVPAWLSMWRWLSWWLAANGTCS